MLYGYSYVSVAEIAVDNDNASVYYPHLGIFNIFNPSIRSKTSPSINLRILHRWTKAQISLSLSAQSLSPSTSSLVSGTSNLSHPSSTNLPSPPTPSTPHSSTPISEHATPNTILSRLSTDAKIGSVLGIVMFILIGAVLVMKFCRRGEGRYARVNGEAQDREEMVERGEGLDSQGVRWPEKVVLRGEAREAREWTVAYGNGRMSGRDGSEDSVTLGEGRTA